MGRLRSALPLVGFVLILLAGRSSLADHYVVPTGSMEPTVFPGDRVFVDKSAYDIRLPFTARAIVATGNPKPGDVVVLKSPVDGRTLLKRIVAVPGQRVAVRDGHVVVSGDKSQSDDDSEVLRGCQFTIRRGDGGPDLEAIVVPPDHYLVLGDNRSDSLDGRYFGLVSRTALRGQARAVYYRDGFRWQSLATCKRGATAGS